MAINAFTVDWNKERVWLVPPLYLIADVIDMLNVCACHGTLVIPGWCSAPWRPKVHYGRNWVSWVRESALLPKDPRTFVAGTCPYNLFGGKEFHCDVYALKVCTKLGCPCYKVVLYVCVFFVHACACEWRGV